MAHASADPRAGKMAETGRHRILQLSRGADQRSGARRLPLLRHRTLAAHAPAPQPEGSHDLGEDHAARQRLAPPTAHPSSLAVSTLCRHTPKVGAVCGKSARTDLCGGRSAMSVPTANEESAGITECSVGTCEPGARRREVAVALVPRSSLN